MKYKIIISNRAKHLLGEHLAFLARKSKPAARELKSHISKEIRSLQSMPQRYPFFSEPYIPPNRYHKLIVDNRYMILYQIKDDTVYVDWIVDCRQDYQWLLT